MKKKYTTPEYRLHRLRSQALLESSPFDNRYYQNQADIRYSSDYVSAEEADWYSYYFDGLLCAIMIKIAHSLIVIVSQLISFVKSNELQYEHTKSNIWDPEQTDHAEINANDNAMHIINVVIRQWLGTRWEQIQSSSIFRPPKTGSIPCRPRFEEHVFEGRYGVCHQWRNNDQPPISGIY